MRWALLVLGIASNAGASLIVKKAVAEPADGLGKTLTGLATSGWLWAGAVLYVVAFGVYALALTRLPLSVAHPILTCGAVASVAVGAVVFYRETIPLLTAVGIALVMGGVVLIASSSS